LACLTQPGRVEAGSVTVTIPPQEYLIYLPPCYYEQTSVRYPVLYLLHGQTFTYDQWVRLGVPQIVDRMMLSGESVPFIVIFPDDHYWNSDFGPGFGDRFIGALIPYIDVTYRTIPNREHRALGGLSRGGGWTAELGFKNPNLFGSLGFHSPAIFTGDAFAVEQQVLAIPEDQRPRIWVDAGDNDRELKSIFEFERMLTRNGIPHEFHFFSGDHSETYWGAHVNYYLDWYAQPWNNDLPDS
jgi:enterochelin esterase-like enzyme